MTIIVHPRIREDLRKVFEYDNTLINSMERHGRVSAGKRLLPICSLAALAGIVLIPLYPVSNTILKLAYLACMLGAWSGFTVFVWKRKSLRVVSLLLPLLAAIPFMLPGGAIDVEDLRRDYVRRLSEFEGTTYVWGGENSRGIDCSGLPRRAFRDALLAYGLTRFNGRAFRSYLEQWWFDASAKALSEGYRDVTRPIGTTGTIREMDVAVLLPGDLAVTTNGIHLLAYAGDGQWIQADPGIGKVVSLDGRTSSNGWFRMPVTTHRWRLLGQP